MTDGVGSAQLRQVPYWMDAAPAAPTMPPPALPGRADVVVVGGGLTGVSAAYELASAGRHTLVLDAAEPGAGASSRNAGMLGWHSHHAFSDLVDTVGAEAAKRFYRELHGIYIAAVHRIEEENLDCGLRRCGRFVGALSPLHYEKLAREFEARAKLLGEDVEILPRSRQSELGSSLYHGGVVIRDNAAIQPARYYRAMRRRAEQAGATVMGHTAVSGLARSSSGFDVATTRGIVQARDVLIATNGYTTRLTPWLARRLIPINAYMVATEPLPEDLARSLFPRNRIYVDSRRRAAYMQLSSDRRLLFGGETGHWPVDPRRVARRLSREMRVLFPALATAKIAYAWTGRCAATWDLYPRVGRHDGLHYALGYCFSGNAMAPYLGTRAARRILGGQPDGDTFFAREPFPAAPWYARSEILMAALMGYYARADRPVP